MIYLATPHSTSPFEHLTKHEREELRDWRAQAAAVHMAYFHIKMPSAHVYSPIAHNHMSDHVIRAFLDAGTTTEYEQYQAWDEHMIDLAAELWVLALPGWKLSRGVISEMRYARDHGNKRIVVVPMQAEVFYNNWLDESPVSNVRLLPSLLADRYEEPNDEINDLVSEWVEHLP